MAAHTVRNLNTSISAQAASVRHGLAVVAALLLLVAFFLPWVTVLDQDTALGEVTGYQLGTGIDDDAITSGAGQAFDTGAALVVFVVPVLGLAVLLAAGMSLMTRRRPGFVLGVYGVSAVLGLGALFFKYAQMQTDLTAAQRETRSLVTLGYEPGWWLSVAALAAVLVTGLLVFRAEDQFRAQPSVARAVRSMRANGLQLGLLGVMFILWFVFIVRAPETFLDTRIYRALMTAIPYWGIIALPLTMVVIAGEIDLSFPSIMAVGMVAFFEVYTRVDSLGLALVGALVSGFLVGLLNGIIIVKLGIPSLIATIGTQFFWRGVVDVMRAGQGESLVFAKETLLRDALVIKVAGYFPAQVLWMVLVGVAVWVILNRHRFGAHVYLIGDNEDSARLMGVNVGLTRIILFALVGLAAAFAGVIQSMDNWYFWPNMGEGYLMQTLAAVFLGGTSVFGGVGTVFGTFIACFIIGALQPGIVAVGLDAYYTKLIYGLTITASVAMHTILRKRLQ